MRSHRARPGRVGVVYFFAYSNLGRANGAALVTRRRLESIGFNVDIKAMDWSTNLAIRARKEPPSQGGRNVLHTWIDAVDVMSPAVHPAVSGAGPSAWFGWPDIPQIEQLTGEWFQPTAFRKNVLGVLKFTAPVFWNVKITRTDSELYV